MIVTQLNLYNMTVINNICKIGQGAACCKYLLLDSAGFHCAKEVVGLKALVDKNWNETKTAQGDNCDGLTREELKT